MSGDDKIKEMMNIELLENILGKERIEILAEQALKEHLDWYFRRDSKAIDNILFRVAHEVTLRFIAQDCETDLRKYCAEAIRNTLDKEGGIGFYMFSDNPKGREILNDEIDKARPYLRESLCKSIDQYVLKVDRQDIEEMMWEHVMSKMLGEKIEREVWMDHGEE